MSGPSPGSGPLSFPPQTNRAMWANVRPTRPRLHGGLSLGAAWARRGEGRGVPVGQQQPAGAAVWGPSRAGEDGGWCGGGGVLEVSTDLLQGSGGPVGAGASAMTLRTTALCHRAFPGTGCVSPLLPHRSANHKPILQIRKLRLRELRPGRSWVLAASGV
uniref:Uncharacterized protein n=1 Tax=Rousettus aegyptiacus TaxID=9407 RepID=A0A7J8IKV8_ROUAE|nr:hypothetical protein HJG63_010497 [Rousettus aegyptiacus]